MDEDAVLLNQYVVEPEFAVAGEYLHHVPVHRRAVPVVALVVGLAGGEVDGTKDNIVCLDQTASE